MIKSIFVNSNNIQDLDNAGANHLIVEGASISPVSWAGVKNLGCNLSIALDAFNKQDCPADPDAQKQMFQKISQALDYNPKEIWLDHFRFGGDCTDIEDVDASKAHSYCDFCKGLDRVDFINSLAEKIKKEIGGRAKVGYFAVAFKSDDATKLRDHLGLDYQKLGQIFDISSPMLYHRMIKKPVSYISEYVKWMSNITGKPVLPIIQIKDMPDDLEDNMTEDDIMAAFNEAKKEPTAGVAIFWWEHALETNKTAIVSRVFSQ